MKASPNPDERAFQKAIRAKPDARVIRLVYADWLDERSDPRGELIRIEEEARSVPIHSDVYWQLKPRRRELLKVIEKPWLKQMGYGGTDYQPVFADIPDGWKERWRLLREFVERWYQIPMDDIGGPLKPFPPGSRYAGDANLRTVEWAMNDPKVCESIPLSVREWMFFIRDLQLSLPTFDYGSSDTHYFIEFEGQVHFTQQDGSRYVSYVRPEERHEADPPVWFDNTQWLWNGSWDGTRSTPRVLPPPRRGPDISRSTAPHVTTMALNFLLTQQYEPQFEHSHEPQEMTEEFARQLADYFPVRSHFDEMQLFERPNMIALWFPVSPFNYDAPAFHLMARRRRDLDKFSDQFQVFG